MSGARVVVMEGNVENKGRTSGEKKKKKKKERRKKERRKKERMKKKKLMNEERKKSATSREKNTVSLLTQGSEAVVVADQKGKPLLLVWNVVQRGALDFWLIVSELQANA